MMLGKSSFLFFGLIVGSAYLARIFALDPPPSFAELAYGLAPFLLFGILVTLFLQLRYTHERFTSALSFVMKTACVASVVACAASLLHLWNDGRYYTILSPSEGLISFVTLGTFPLHAGPNVLVRFFPVVFAIASFIRRRSVATTLAVYAALAGFTHALSWFAGAFAVMRRETIDGSADAIRLLIHAQADGYWTRAQAARFFASSGLQSENSFQLIHAAVLFIGIFFILVFLGRQEIRGFDLLVKRLFSRQIFLFGSMMLFGFTIGSANRFSMSYTDILASLVYIVSALAWLFAWQLHRDSTSVAQDERERPDAPIPSGFVSIHDAESVRNVSLSLALTGSFLLGWPVFLGVLTATITEVVRTAFRANESRATALRDSGAFAVIAASLGSAAFALALRDAAAPSWMLRLLFSFAFLVGMESLIRHIDNFSRARGIQAASILFSLAVAFFLAYQRVLWLLFFPMAAGILILLRNASTWPRHRSFVIPITFAVIGFITLFAPRFLSS